MLQEFLFKAEMNEIALECSIFELEIDFYVQVDFGNEEDFVFGLLLLGFGFLLQILQLLDQFLVEHQVNFFYSH